MEILELDLERDYAGIDQLLEQEEWPFSRSDLEVSHEQPKATSFVARQGDKLEGFFTTHNFLDIGYLDMMVVQPGFRKLGVARKLYLATMEALRRKGINALVVHTTRDSFPLIRFLKFKQGCSFTLLALDQQEASPARCRCRRLSQADDPALLDLDALVFGARREAWLGSLTAKKEIPFYGVFSEEGNLQASLCLRPRRGGAVCIDAANALSLGPLLEVTDFVLAQHPHQRIECFARTDSDYHHALLERGFAVPEFFTRIGPLVEWRKGEVGRVGASEKIRCLVWL